ncbi:MAG: TlpA family protein disulfide reductase [Rhodobacteraceae bacterium]|nr:TlpA family protein disulfide reductase [Paracoccaceae bacterium]
MKTTLVALLYAALSLGANPVFSQEITPELRAELLDLREGNMRKLKIHKEPQEAVLTTFTDAVGTRVSLADGNGKIRVVNFWATWCYPCREEMPTLDALQKGLGGEGFEVLAIATGLNQLGAIESFLEEANVTALPIWLDADSSLGADFGAIGLPLTVILNRDGQEIARLIGGAEWYDESAQNILKTLIALE